MTASLRHHRRRAAAALLAGCLCALAPAADAQETPGTPAEGAARPAPCSRPEHRAFDFWIGEWDVTTPDGRRAGENRIEVTSGGCVLQESWSGAGGMTGTSLNGYDPGDGRWHQTWMDSNGLRLELSGGPSGEAMVLEGERPSTQRPGARVLHRIRWEPRSDGSVRQLWEISEDEGATWGVAFDGRYTRKR
jgi:hypothetical protein